LYNVKLVKKTDKLLFVGIEMLQRRQTVA